MLLISECFLKGLLSSFKPQNWSKRCQPQTFRRAVVKMLSEDFSCRVGLDLTPDLPPDDRSRQKDRANKWLQIPTKDQQLISQIYIEYYFHS